MHSLPEITERFRQALDYAAQKHAQQTRKASDVPYLSHLLGVASIVMANTRDEDVWIASLLHDAIEDQGGEPTAKEIEMLFGKRVADLVRGCSEMTAEVNTPKPSWIQRKTTYLQKLPHVDHAVILISIADKLHNARSVLGDWRIHGDEIYNRFSTGKSGTHWYYQNMIKAYHQANAPQHLLQELEETVAKFAPDTIDLTEITTET